MTASDHMFRLLVQSVSDCALYMLDLDGHVTNWNPGAERIEGYSASEIIGHHFSQFYTPEDIAADEPARALMTALKEERYADEGWRTRKDGSRFVASVVIEPVKDDNGVAIGFASVTRDITARRQAEDELQAAHRELERISRLTTVGAMTASIAHWLNQPLAAIVTNGNAGLRWLNRPEPDIGEVRAVLRRVVDEGHRASQIIDGIRAMFRRDQAQRTPVVINDLVREVVTASLAELQGHRVSLMLELMDGLQQVDADGVQLQQVLFNLIRNGIDSMKPVEDRARVLRVRSEYLEPDCVVVSVQDSGGGISQEHAERLFEAFFTTKANGMGLGLSICRSIVEAHGGWISAAPAHPHGAIFQVMLPAVQRAADAA